MQSTQSEQFLGNVGDYAYLFSKCQLPGDAIKRDPEKENYALLTIAAQTANSIHIRVTFNVVTRYMKMITIFALHVAMFVVNE